MCQSVCVDGMAPCGPALCTPGGISCAGTLMSMVLTPIALAINLYTLGGFGAVGGDDAIAAPGNIFTQVSNSAQQTLTALQAAGLNTVGMSAQTFATMQQVASTVSAYGSPAYTAVTQVMDAAQADLGAITNAYTARTFEQRYPRGTPNYQQVARNMAFMASTLAAQELALRLGVVAAGLADPTGVVNAFAAYNHRRCRGHYPFPTIATPSVASATAQLLPRGDPNRRPS